MKSGPVLLSDFFACKKLVSFLVLSDCLVDYILWKVIIAFWISFEPVTNKLLVK